METTVYILLKKLIAVSFNKQTELWNMQALFAGPIRHAYPIQINIIYKLLRRKLMNIKGMCL